MVAPSSSAGILKFLKPSLRPHPVDFQAAIGWGAAFSAGGLFLVQPWDWIRKTFIEPPPQEEQQ